jgi:hypothetical protein
MKHVFFFVRFPFASLEVPEENSEVESLQPIKTLTKPFQNFKQSEIVRNSRLIILKIKKPKSTFEPNLL